MSAISADRSDALASGAIWRELAALVPALLVAYDVLVWPLLFAQPVYTSSFDYEALQSDTATSVFTAVYVASILAIALIGFAGAGARLAQAQRNLMLWIGLFLLLAFASSAWSLGPLFTLKKAIYQSLLLATIACAAFAARDGHRMLIRLFALFAAVVVVNLHVVLTQPAGLIGHEGIYAHKNGLGQNAGIAFILAAYLLLVGRAMLKPVALAVMAGAIVLLVQSESKTAMGLTVLAPVGAAVLLVLVRWFSLGVITALALALGAAAACYAVASQLAGFDASDVLLAIFNDDTLTGRTDIWAFISEHIKNAPLLGHGYQGFWGIGPDAPKLRAELPFIQRMPHGHNGYLDMMLSLGALGLGLLLLLNAKVLRHCGAIDRRDAGLSFAYLALLLFLIGTNLTESVVLLSEGAGNVLFLLIALLSVSDPDPLEQILGRAHAMSVAGPGAPSFVASTPQAGAAPPGRSAPIESTKKVCICIPTFRRPIGLKRLLTALPQLTGPFELTVIVADNDPAGGAGLKVAAQLQAQGYKLPLLAIPAPERGIAPTRNALVAAALDRTDASFIAMIDDDAWPAPTWLELLHRTLLQTGADMANGSVHYLYEDRPLRGLPEFGALGRKRMREGLVPILYTTSNLLARRAVFERMKRPWFDADHRLTGGEDDDFFVRAKEEKHRFATSPRALIVELVPATRATRQFLCERSFAHGASWAYIRRKRRPAGWSPALELGKVLAGFVVGIVAWPFAVWSPKYRLYAEFRLYRAAGKIKGLCGGMTQLYGTTHGR